MEDRADGAGLDELSHFAPIRLVAQLVVDAGQPAAPLRDLEHLLRLPDRERHRLLAQHVLPRLQRRDRVTRVGVDDTITRSTSGARASASPLPNALGMPSSTATARARSALPLAIAVTTTPGTRRSAGTCTRRANPVPISPTRSVTTSTGRKRCPPRAARRRTRPRAPRARRPSFRAPCPARRH